MSETEASPVVPALPSVELPVVEARPARRRSLWPILGVIGFLLLAGGEATLYRLQRAVPDTSTPIAVLQAQVAGLQLLAGRTQPAADSVTVQADLAQKFADLNAQVTELSAQSASDHATLATLAANNIDLTKITGQMALLSRLEAGRMALDAGQPLGDIPGAPPALANFTATPPPTQAALLLSYPAAARAADLASVEKLAGVSYWSRVKARVESLVTITDGARVVVGPPAAAIVEQARALLNAGDLGGAVDELDGLSPTTQAAMGDWLRQARDLLAARAALIAMASRG